MYNLNSLVVAGCRDPYVRKQIMQLAVERGIDRYQMDFDALSLAGFNKKKWDGRGCCYG